MSTVRANSTFKFEETYINYVQLKVHNFKIGQLLTVSNILSWVSKQRTAVLKCWEDQ